MQGNVYVDLVTSAMAAVGSLLVLSRGDLKREQARLGVWLIFGGFVGRAGWDAYELGGCIGIVCVGIIVAVGLGLYRSVSRAKVAAKKPKA